MSRRTVKGNFLRNVLEEALPFTVLAFVILTTLVFVQQAGKYSEITLSFQTSPAIVRQFLISLLPGIIVITMPVSLLLGTIITCSRLSADNELTAAQSLGISQIRLSIPFLVLGLSGTLLTGYMSVRVAPLALKKLKALQAQIVLRGANTQIRPHTFITSFPDLLLYVQDVDPATNQWVGVFALQNDQDRGVTRLLTAERGQFRLSSFPSLKLEAELNRGVSLEYQNLPAAPGEPGPTIQARSNAASDFQKLSIKLADKEGNPEAASALRLNEMTLRELNRNATTASTPKERIQAVAEWHRRFAFPFACLILTALTFITSIQGRQFSTRPRTAIAILFIAMAYYLLLIIGQNVASSGRLPAWISAWFANVLGALLALRAIITNRTPIPFLMTWATGRGRTGAKKAVAEKSMTADRPAALFLGGVRLGIFNLISLLLLSEIAKFYLIAVLSLVATSIIFTLFDLIPAIIRSGTSLLYAGSYLAYLAPQLAYAVSPFSLLVGLLMGLSVLGRTNQLVAIAGTGQSKLRIITSALFIAILIAGGLWSLSNYILPFTNREQDIRYQKIKGRQLEQTTIAFGKKWVYGKNNTIYSYQRIEPDNTLMNTSVYHLTRGRGVLDTAIHFKKAVQNSEKIWEPVDGFAEVIGDNLSIQRMTLAERPHILTIEDGPGLFKRTVNQSSKMSEWDLRFYISQLKSIGIATLELQIDLNKRLAFPFSCLTLAVLAIPFISIKQSRRSSPLASVALSVGIGLVFWLLMTFFEAAGKQSSLPVTIAVWAPQILFGAIGLYLNFFRYRKQ
jgi:LPS export ABC transporter permease LptG